MAALLGLLLVTFSSLRIALESLSDEWFVSLGPRVGRRGGVGSGSPTISFVISDSEATIVSSLTERLLWSEFSSFSFDFSSLICSIIFNTKVVKMLNICK